MKVLKALRRILPFALLAAVLLATVFYPKRQSSSSAARVVNVWNVDTFEGGKGSRTSFLARAARRVEAEHEGLYFFVTSYSKEGATAALKSGKKPDILSFGVGLSDFMEESLPLPYEFSGGEVGGKCLAVPWCRGKYTLFSRSGDFSKVENAVISLGGSNLARVAAMLGGVEGTAERSEAAYTDFLGGKFEYLLGTQRDACRFAARGENVSSRDIDAFCDLYQYFSVLSEGHWQDCMLFLEEVRGPRTQSLLSEIGMFPADGGQGKTVGVFCTDGTLAQIDEAARNANANFSEKYLKTV